MWFLLNVQKEHYYNENAIEDTNLDKYKQTSKNSIWIAFSKKLQEKQKQHIKVNHIVYDHKRNPQKYLISSKFNNEICSLLYNLRCSSVIEFRDNFHTLYGKTPLCKLCGLHIDSQELALSCEKVKENLTEADLMIINNVKYKNIYGKEERQLILTQIFQRILQIRATASIPPASLPGLHNSGPDWLVIVSYWKYIYIYASPRKNAH